ncbi:unnamed protein product, partial [Tenebrio molitor]
MLHQTGAAYVSTGRTTVLYSFNLLPEVHLDLDLSCCHLGVEGMGVNCRVVGV